MITKKLFLLSALVMFLAFSATAQDFTYIGASKCKMCHNKEEKGEQYNKWQAAAHSNAMKTLSSEKSLAYAEKNGIADPTKEAKCLKCHSTYGHVDADLRAGIKVDEGVSCESCHGPGSAYKSMSVMKSREKSVEKGLILPTKEVCLKCHNKENPFFKPFDFDAALVKIAHPNPETGQ